MRDNDTIKEIGIFLHNEKVQFVTSKLRIEILFCFLRFVIPIQDKPELGKLRSGIECLVQFENVSQIIVLLKFCRDDVVHRQCVAFLKHINLFRLRKMLIWIQ